jgi:energy-coupling factor transporter ATP-binding protein EcfA2
MADLIYTASKNKTQERPGWSMSFRHPLRTDANGVAGRKMRKGLGTTDEAEADRLVAQMNALLSDPAWWNASKREEAARTFDAIVVSAFYDGIQAGRPDSWSVREKLIELPTSQQGYARILLVGTTGAGKTSLLRHLIGSDPERDRFPSTSTARTTISDIEVVLKSGPYSAAVTFFSEFWVQANLEECISDACFACWEGASRDRIAERLLNHRDQRFRLSYTLGQWQAELKGLDENDWSFGGDESPTLPAEDAISDLEREANEAALKDYVERIVSLSARTMKTLSNEQPKDVRALTGLDREAAQESFEKRVRDDAAFSDLVDDIFERIREKFKLLEAGKLEHHPSGWPSKWTFETTDRTSLIEQIRWFSSNGAGQFGRLLTPFVDGVRVRGPLFPDFTAKQPKLVLLDGEGLGHTPDSSASVTTHITKRFEDVDVILLVDNSQQPMQAAPLSVVRSVAVGGHQHKLGIAFTHFDRVEGINLPTPMHRRAHVMASVTNGLANLKDALGNTLVKSIERTINHQCFILGALDKSSHKLPNGVKTEFVRMLHFFEHSTTPASKVYAGPKYNPDGLLLALQMGARGFRRPWAARLGLGANETAHKEHWTRIKALNRRIAGEIATEYDSLKPVADLLARLSEEISQFLDHPTGWLPPIPSEEDAETVIAAIKREVYAELHTVIDRRLLKDHLADWRETDYYSGKGSTFLRAQGINSIYESSAPIVTTVTTDASAEFVREIRGMVYRAIQANGGRLQVEQ